MGSSSLGDRMEDIINNYRSQINIQEVKKRFPEMTESETPVWHGGPALMSMFGKYALSILVLLVHIIFFWAAKFEDVEGEGNLNLVVGLAKVILDVSGVLGFVIVMMLIAKINHFLNTSTSGGWTTILAGHQWINSLYDCYIGLGREDSWQLYRWRSGYANVARLVLPASRSTFRILLRGNHHSLQKLVPIRNHRQESPYQKEVLVF